MYWLQNYWICNYFILYYILTKRLLSLFTNLLPLLKDSLFYTFFQFILTCFLTWSNHHNHRQKNSSKKSGEKTLAGNEFFCRRVIFSNEYLPDGFELLWTFFSSKLDTWTLNFGFMYYLRQKKPTETLRGGLKEMQRLLSLLVFYCVSSLNFS